MFKIPSTLIKLIAKIISISPWLSSKVNAFAINGTIKICRHRPHPLSMAHDYVSWTTLTDQKWNARHLPPKSLLVQPPLDQLKELFRRPDGTQQLCKKSTCLFPAFAQYLTDGFIRTKMDLRSQNTSNHQIDLCTLYGRTQEQTLLLRKLDNSQGLKGRLKSQEYKNEEYSPFLYDKAGLINAEFRELDPPLGIDDHPTLKNTIFAVGGDRVNSVPQIVMINTLFLREHNRLARLIETENPSWDDERVFQTARNCVIVIFIKVVVEEYINHISPIPIPFRVDPSVAFNAPWNKPNWITAEFSLLYRWHSLIPDMIKWNGVPYPVHETFMNNQLLLDTGLAKGFVEISSQTAARLGPLNTTDKLLGIEKLAIEQGRQNRFASYLDYREYVSLSKPKSFSEISSNPKVVKILNDLYGTIENVEFYIGLFAEDLMENSPLPPLILRMVAVDAFSQALTNPLLSENVFKPSTFSNIGWEMINGPNLLKDIVARNVSSVINTQLIMMTRTSWTYQ